ncbi:hypothetical protein AOL_s00117g69 [Orbilia oligospora ATCC 24927]|uniref:PCI domain-containing protein n=1 Tax=Arthrobotrys oligospora (strain ATCC 24927 / CBS 115.81 / DSM 1491) TaxID=756982 RepID=G1XM22_ARTOA|nr:hypothetical protein AOL_s00117g69 [Orbilia oligospora ATCC 24927]EGX45864.1 hypothetical protein AOL_s00117g69 [Orbilia oligospora ATCC 24927]
MTLPEFLSNWLSALSSILTTGDADAFGLFFGIDTRPSKTTTYLQQALASSTLDEDAELDAIRDIIDPDDQWSSIARMVQAYLLYLRSARQDIGLSHRFELLLKFMNAVSSAADNNNGAVLNVLVLEGSKHITRLGIMCDDLADDGSYKYSEQAHSVVQKLFNVSLKGVRLPNDLGKRETSVGIINCLFKLASKMGRIGSMTTIIVNLQNVLPSINITSDTRFSVAQRCTYAYYIGIECFQTAQFLKAANTLQEAFDLCHPSFLRNRRKILIHLVASNIILGRFPSSDLYNLPEAVQLREVFSPIIKAIKVGNFTGFERALFRSKKWLLHFDIFHDLEIRCETLMWRNLIKNVFAVSGSTAKNGVESVGLDKILEAALVTRAGLRPRVVGQTINGQKEFRETITESSILSIVLGLVDNGWLNGYVNLEKGMLAGWSSKSRLITRLADIKNQYVGMLWGGENGSGVTEKEGSGEKVEKDGETNGFPAAAAAAAPAQQSFGGLFAGGFGDTNGNGNGGGYATDPGDDMEMEL